MSAGTGGTTSTASRSVASPLSDDAASRAASTPPAGAPGFAVRLQVNPPGRPSPPTAQLTGGQLDDDGGISLLGDEGVFRHPMVWNTYTAPPPLPQQQPQQPPQQQQQHAAVRRKRGAGVPAADESLAKRRRRVASSDAARRRRETALMASIKDLLGVRPGLTKVEVLEAVESRLQATRLCRCGGPASPGSATSDSAEPGSDDGDRAAREMVAGRVRMRDLVSLCGMPYSVSVCVIDVTRERVVAANGSWLRHLQFTEEDVRRGITRDMLMPQRDRNMCNTVSALIQTGKVRRVRDESFGAWLRADGTEYWASRAADILSVDTNSHAHAVIFAIPVPEPAGEQSGRCIQARVELVTDDGHSHEVSV